MIFTSGSLRRMARHLADPEVGAATAYIKEGSRPANYMNRFIAYEYVTAQAVARRAQNVLGVQACLAGGAQLIRRESLEAVGGEIDTTTLAEDTVTTFRIQLAGKRVVFEPHAIVWAEEPRSVDGLWKQRLRWSRGNMQVTPCFAGVAAPAAAGRSGQSELRPDLVLRPADAGLPHQLLHGPDHLVPQRPRVRGARVQRAVGDQRGHLPAHHLLGFSIDPAVARMCWREGVAFPGW